MKNLMSLLLILSCNALFADINIKPVIKSVTVYAAGAQINAVADANITKGTYSLVFENVSQYIDENSIQLKGNADFTILSIAVKKDFLNENYKDASLLKLEDSLAKLKLKAVFIQNFIAALRDESAMLKANQKISGANTNLSVIELEKMANFVRNRTEEINNKISEQNVAAEKLTKKIADLQNQINTYNAENNKNKADIVVSIKSNVASKTDFELSYNVANAGWSSFYDIKAENITAPVIIISKAKVWQNTGEDWKDVKLFISTGNPSVSMNIPPMNPYYVNIQPENVVMYRSKNAVSNYGAVAAPSMQYDMEAKAKGSRSSADEMSVTSSNSSNYTTNTESQTNNVFEISIPYTIKSDGAENLVGIQKYEVPAKYNYICKPKVEQGAFLQANLVDWNQSGLLPGEANVFFEGAYIGKTYFETSVANDTIAVSFGRDNNIVAERKRTKLLNDKNFVSGNKNVAFEYEITVKNKKKTNVDITIEDQIPLSSNTNTEVLPDENSKADYNKETGLLKWTINLKAGENISYKFGFKVRFPKGYKITNL